MGWECGRPLGVGEKALKAKRPSRWEMGRE